MNVCLTTDDVRYIAVHFLTNYSAISGEKSLDFDAMFIPAC